jgi:hypothetical protein
MAAREVRPVTVLVSGDVTRALALGEAWISAGRPVTVVLLDAAAGLVRPGHQHGDALRSARDAGVRVAAHDGALRRRGLEQVAREGGVHVIDLDTVAEMVGRTGDRTVWL